MAANKNFFHHKRKTPAERGYDREWKRLRKDFLKENPWCVFCNKAALHVDHIRSVKEFPHLRLNPSNLRSLCHSCHSRRTMHDQVHKVTYGAGPDGYPVHPNHPWNKK